MKLQMKTATHTENKLVTLVKSYQIWIVIRLFLIDIGPGGIPFGAKSIGKWQL